MEFRPTSLIGGVRRPDPPRCNRAAAALLSRLAKRPSSGRFNEGADQSRILLEKEEKKQQKRKKKTDGAANEL